MLDVLKSKKYNFTQLDKLNVLSKASAGLWHLHEQGFIHRDIALRNVLVDIRNFQVKLTDFGLSRITHTISDAGKTTSHILPIAWTAPECISQNMYSPKSDVWRYPYRTEKHFRNPIRHVFYYGPHSMSFGSA